MVQLRNRNIVYHGQDKMQADTNTGRPSTQQIVIVYGIPLLMSFLGIIFTLGGAADKQEGVTRPSAPIPVLHQFNIIFKKTGALLPFVPLLYRLAVSRLGKSSLPNDFTNRHCKGIRIFAGFVIMTLIRAVAYSLTLLKSKDIMSDHVFLALSVSALCRFELHVCLETYHSNRLIHLATMMNFIIVVCVNANNYVTARYFHTTEESVNSLLCGFLLFEIPGTIC
ncbi:hypothetical protein GUITHDRAFT_133514 [Guillardia theta CCMP2712]|uniref:Uncharacterized protein n=1 Tax=Guillardia theta (strain CCMP2712) TaxID=905079 RepID=L1JW40_GUITC|nr:hypothetical protein GUITHDRAFT_133514 [Guillardia theta CCMP2712]EKX52420.1 hypothetical protein GUITHDRAFT_133514 [Guillardia theta CCMP2712]|eukprot:XP_005839400.1 hypothetical protein GUITHDRAFT_133514 [Guillardia theta CCMP2712]